MSGPEPERPRWADLRARLAAVGFTPSKTLGQNFLVDANMARAIARDAGVGAGDRVLEGGPGCGSLSLELVRHEVELVAVEIDPRLATIARAELAPFPSARVLETDVLDRKSRLARPVVELLDAWAGRPWHLAANLPYAVSGPVLVLLARRPEPPASMTVLVQRELADRVAARPGSPAHGTLGLKLGPLYEASIPRTVPAGLFWPRPRVESAVLRLARREGAPPAFRDAEHAARFDRLVDGLFQRRRKTLRKALGAHLDDVDRAAEALEAAALDPGGRAETLSWPELLRLEAILAGRAEGEPGGP